MAENLIARKQTGWLVVSIAPDICRTPMGKSKPPVPYAVIARLDESVQVTESVRVNGHPQVVYDFSIVPRTIGDEPGTAKGIHSHTVEGNCYPKEYSSTVRSEGKPIVRHDDLFWMNGR